MCKITCYAPALSFIAAEEKTHAAATAAATFITRGPSSGKTPAGSITTGVSRIKIRNDFNGVFSILALFAQWGIMMRHYF